MSTVQEIELAIGRLPLEQKAEICHWLEKVLGDGRCPEGYFADDYAAMDEERLKVEECSLKVPQSSDR